jgi:hypothetical protein
VKLAVATPRTRVMAVETVVAVTPPPAARRLAREALLLRTFRRWPKRVERRLSVDIAAGRPVRAWEVQRAFLKCGLTSLLGGEPMFREAWKALGLR